MARLAGVDLARALAVFGMFTVHVGPAPTPGRGVGDWFLIAGRREPKTGLAGRQPRARILIRVRPELVPFARPLFVHLADRVRHRISTNTQTPGR